MQSKPSISEEANLPSAPTWNAQCLFSPPTTPFLWGPRKNLPLLQSAVDTSFLHQVLPFPGGFNTFPGTDKRGLNVDIQGYITLHFLP